MSALVAELTALRRRFAQLRPRRWVDGRRTDGSFGVLWLTPKATEMAEDDWKFPEGRFLSYVLNSAEAGEAPLYIVLNAAPEAIAFNLPALPEYGQWIMLLNTAAVAPSTGKEFASGATMEAPPRSVLVFAGTA